MSHSIDRFELRRQDLSLDSDQQAVREGFGDFFRKECPSSMVRAAEPLGFDADLWKRLASMGVAAMGLPVASGGDGATLVDLVLAAEECGRVVAPVPLVTQVVAARLLARAGAPAVVTAAVAAGDRLVALDLRGGAGGSRRLVPDAAIASNVIGWSADGLILYTRAEPASHVPNQGSTPLAWFEPGDSERTVLAHGPEAEQLFADAVREWKLLTAAALVGIAESALLDGAEFAKSRRTLGVAIGTLQGVAFPLAESATAVAGARNLVWKAAWLAEHEPGGNTALIHAAFDYAARTASEVTSIAAHVQGGLGFTVEADISLYFLRAKGWSLLGGDPADDRRRVAEALITATESGSA